MIEDPQGFLSFRIFDSLQCEDEIGIYPEIVCDGEERVQIPDRCFGISSSHTTESIRILYYFAAVKAKETTVFGGVHHQDVLFVAHLHFAD